MAYTVADFINSFSGRVKLLTGSGGLTNVIEDIGMLDYELDETLRNKYVHSSFRGQLVLTSFLYAKDDPFLITDAVKYLLSNGARALAVKNVFRLPIADSTLRYADSRNFPIISVPPDGIYFEDLVYEVRSLAKTMSDAGLVHRELDLIVAGGLTEAELLTHVRQINPSFEQHLLAVYFKSGGSFGQNEYLKMRARFEASGLAAPAAKLCLYKRGALLLYSNDETSALCGDSFVERLCAALTEEADDFSIGVSREHFSLSEFRECLRECLCASLFEAPGGAGFTRYDSLGSYRILLPFAGSEALRRFRDDVAGPVVEYDIENRSELFNSLSEYVLCGCDLHAAAQKMSVHENTLRYRLEKIASLTGLDYKRQEQLEQLSLAMKIDRCERLLEGTAL